jgi:hypothetical protein
MTLTEARATPINATQLEGAERRAWILRTGGHSRCPRCGKGQDPVTIMIGYRVSLPVDSTPYPLDLPILPTTRRLPDEEDER